MESYRNDLGKKILSITNGKLQLMESYRHDLGKKILTITVMES